MKIAQEILEFFKIEEAQMDSATAFSLLGLDHGDYAGVDRAFKKMAMKHHPDLGGDVEMMKKLNQAKDALEGGKGTSTGRSKDAMMADIVAKNQVRITKAKVVTEFIFNSLNKEVEESKDEINNYLSKMMGKAYTSKLKATKAENIFDANAWAGVGKGASGRDAQYPFDGRVKWQLEFDSVDSSNSKFILELVAQIQMSTIEKSLSIEGLELEMAFETFAYNDGKRTKMQQKRWGSRAKASSLGKPEEFFPIKKMQKMTSTETTRLTKKADAFSFLDTEMKAFYPYTDKDTLHVPVGENLSVKMRRMVFMKKAVWAIQGLYRQEGKYKYTQLIKPASAVKLHLADIPEIMPDFAEIMRKVVALIADQDVDGCMKLIAETQKEYTEVIEPKIAAKLLK